MANQDYVVMTNGIGADPSGAYTQIDTGWDTSVDDMTIKYLPSAIGIIADPGATAAGETDTYYSSDLALIPTPGVVLYIPDSADDQIHFDWQWYDAKDEGYDEVGEKVEGTWTDYGSGSANAALTERPRPDVESETAMLYKGSKVRVKMTVTDAGGDGVAVGLVTAAVNALNNTSTGAFIQMPVNKQAKHNAGIVSIEGIGADPS